MASHPPAQCCTIGVKHIGEPSGQMTRIDSGKIEAYVATASGTVHPHAALLFLPDVIGIWQNSKLMADQFGANGYYTLMPDLFNGDSLALNRPPDFDLQKWKTYGSYGKNPHTTKEIDPIIEAAVQELRAQGYKKIGGVGYCFGAKYVCRFLAGKGIDVAYCAHPHISAKSASPKNKKSFVDEEELAAIQGPLSISAAETDQIFPAEKRHKSEEILVRTRQPYQINLFSGVAHGFAVRCDTSNKQQKFAKEQAFLQAIAWFNEQLM